MLNPNYKKIKEKFSGKKVLVVGLGLLGGGLGVARFFAELGAQVTVTDKKNKNQLISSINQLKNLPVIFHLGAHRLEDFLSADVIFKGPAVPWSLPEIEAALQKQIPVEMELSFVAAYSPAKIIGITGTRGKSTTTKMIYELLKNNQFPVYFGGSSPHISSIEYLKKLTEKDWLLMELPSWPLSGFHRKKISPHIAVFTNFYPDHLNYYPTMDNYLFDKKAIYLYQKPTDFLIANKTLEPIISKDHPQSQVNYYQTTDFKQKFDYLRGEHNRENAAAAIAVAKVLGLNLSQSFGMLKSLKNISYRQQIVGQKGKIIFVNDTTSTTPIATIKALEAFGDKNIILILGGNSKNLPSDDLITSLTSTKKIVLLGGSFTKEILPRLQKKYPEKLTAVYESLEEAIFKAWELAQKLSGETYILFSPGATSFAMFNNEFHRGDEFNKIVQKLIS